MTVTTKILSWIEMGPKRFGEIENLVNQAAAGDSAAELALGELDDREFARWLQVRRQRRLTDVDAIADAAKAKQVRLPNFPAKTGASGEAGVGNLAGDPPAVRGVERILAALQAG